MRKLIPLATVIAIAGGLTAGVVASAATTAVKIKCDTTEYNPTPTQASGVVVGFTSCSEPLGKGVVSASLSIGEKNKAVDEGIQDAVEQELLAVQRAAV
jgi:hypothetical protein